MTLKVAIVGCGKIADGHAEEIGKLPPGRAVLVACCDRELLLAEQLATRYDIPRHYDNYEQMLTVERPDVVHVTTPPQSHLALAKQAIDAGAHAYVEKPFAMNAAEARELIDHSTRKTRKVTVGWASFFDPPALEMRRRIAEGAIGDPVHIESACGYTLDGPFGRVLLSDSSHWIHKLPGKLIHNIIDHPLSKIAEFLPDDQPEVLAMGYSLRPERFGDVRDDLLDELRVILRGERVSAYLTFSSQIQPVVQFVRVFGTRGAIVADYNARTVTPEPSVRLPSAIGRLLPAFEQARAFFVQGGKNVGRFAKGEFQFFAGLQEQLRRFYDACEDRGDVPVPYREIVRVCWMMEEIWRQIALPPRSSREPPP